MADQHVKILPNIYNILFLSSLSKAILNIILNMIFPNGHDKNRTVQKSPNTILRLDLLSCLITRAHLCATCLFATNSFGKYIVISDMIYFKRFYVIYL